MQLYGDIFFLYNLIMDYIVLKMTAVLWGARRRGLFWWCAAANLSYLAAVTVSGLSPAMPCFFLAAALLFGLRPRRKLHFFGMLVTAFFITFFLGSLSLGLTAVFGADAFAVTVPAAILLFVLDKIEKSPKLGEITGLYPVEISVPGKSVKLTALSDSGNGLKIDGSPVMIADPRAVSPLLPYITDIFTHRCRTVTGEAGLDCFYAQAKIGEMPAKRTCVAISGAPISGNFEALINAEFLERDQKIC